MDERDSAPAVNSETAADSGEQPMTQPAELVAEEAAEPAQPAPAAESLFTAPPLPDVPSGPLCPWCSQPIEADAPSCASCGAVFASDAKEEELEVPGLTTVHPSFAAMAVRATKTRPHRRSAAIAGWLAGDPATVPLPPTEIPGITATSAPSVPGLPAAATAISLKPSDDAVAPPSEDVRLEMLRLELESRRRELEAAIEHEVPDEESKVDRS
jgi:hypothetical protein